MRKAAFDSGSATVPVAPFGVPPNGPESGADPQLDHHTAIATGFGRRPKEAGEMHAHLSWTKDSGDHRAKTMRLPKMAI